MIKPKKKYHFNQHYIFVPGSWDITFLNEITDKMEIVRYTLIANTSVKEIEQNSKSKIINAVRVR